MNYVIASFPRSGNHLVRYIIEYITDRPTLGDGDDKWSRTVDGPILKRIDENYKYSNNTPIAVKRHVIKEIDKGSKAIFIFRNPVECIIKHYLHSQSLQSLHNPDNPYLLSLIDMYENLVGYYLDNQFFKDDLYIPFESLVFSEEKVLDIINSIATILPPKSIKKIRLNDILSSFNVHFEKSKGIYELIDTTDHAEHENFWREKIAQEDNNLSMKIYSKIYRNESLWKEFENASK